MTKIQKERPELIRIGKLREYTLEVCECKKYVCTTSELREYEILERS